MKVLYAEDNEDIRESVIDLADARGLTICGVEDGRVLVERAREGGYDLILTDNDMPNLTGIEAIREIREFDKQTPIWMYFGADRERYDQIVSEARSLGVERFYAKPVDSLRMIGDLETLSKN